MELVLEVILPMVRLDLRPIGTEFWYEHPPDEHSTSPHGCRIKYKVIEHVKVERFWGDKEGELAERWKPLVVEIDENPRRFL